MAVEAQTIPVYETERERKIGQIFRRVALLLSIVLLVVGAVGAPLLTRIYFIHGGARIWVTTIVQFVGFPLMLPLIYGSYVYRRRLGDRRVVFLSVKALAVTLVVGLISAFISFLYSYGALSLPASTSTLLFSTQIIFTALFAFLLVRQKFTVFAVNAVVLLVVGAVLLGVQSSTERPPDESNSRYYRAFFAMIGSAILYGLMMPLIQWIYWRLKQTPSLATVLEMQFIICVSGGVFSAVGMLINHDFPAISREAGFYELGKTKYYLVLGGAAIFWQLMTLGFLGVIACSSALLAGVVLAMLIPVGEIAPVLLLGEKFTSAKGIATVLCVWGFVSYLYGEHRQAKQKSPPQPPPTGDGDVEIMSARGTVVPAETPPL